MQPSYLISPLQDAEKASFVQTSTRADGDYIYNLLKSYADEHHDGTVPNPWKFGIGEHCACSLRHNRRSNAVTFPMQTRTSGQLGPVSAISGATLRLVNVSDHLPMVTWRATVTMTRSAFAEQHRKWCGSIFRLENPSIVYHLCCSCTMPTFVNLTSIR